LDSDFFINKATKFFMIKFTPEDLVQYIYRETSEQKMAAINTALNTDWNLRDLFEQISSDLKNLEEVHLSPRNEAVDRILQHITIKHGQLFPH
jgi:hypothetical protein